MAVVMGLNQVLRFLLELCALGTFIAPKAAVDAPPALRLLLELAVFGSAIAGLYASGRLNLAATLAVVYVPHRGLTAVLR